MEQFSKLLSSRLARQQQTAEAHPAADSLTAFAENRLRPNQRKPLLAHLAICSDCREVLSLISPDAAPAPSVPRPSVQWWNLRWAGALATACLIAVIVLRHPSHAPSSPVEIVNKPALAAIPAAAPAIAPVLSPTQKKVAPPRVSVLPKRADAAPALSIAPMPELPSYTSQQPPEIFQPLTVQLPSPPPITNVGQHALAAGSAPASSQAFLPQQTSRSSAQVRALSDLAKATALAWKRQTLWRIGNTPGALIGSDDGGLTWRTVPVAGQANLLSLSVSGTDIWAGAETGALFHSTDNGLHWSQQRIPFTGAITAIHADESLIRLTTKAGEWLSYDDGATWVTK